MSISSGRLIFVGPSSMSLTSEKHMRTTLGKMSTMYSNCQTLMNSSSSVRRGKAWPKECGSPGGDHKLGNLLARIILSFLRYQLPLNAQSHRGRPGRCQRGAASSAERPSPFWTRTELSSAASQAGLTCCPRGRPLRAQEARRHRGTTSAARTRSSPSEAAFPSTPGRWCPSHDPSSTRRQEERTRTGPGRGTDSCLASPPYL